MKRTGHVFLLYDQQLITICIRFSKVLISIVCIRYTLTEEAHWKTTMHECKARSEDCVTDTNCPNNIFAYHPIAFSLPPMISSTTLQHLIRRSCIHCRIEHVCFYPHKIDGIIWRYAVANTLPVDWHSIIFSYHSSFIYGEDDLKIHA